MTKETFELLEGYMLSCMEDSAHDKQHIYRVLYNALEIAAAEPQTDYDILIAACLLHDIGRKEQFENPALCHAQVGAKKAYDFLIANGFGEGFAGAVSHCKAPTASEAIIIPENADAKSCLTRISLTYRHNGRCPHLFKTAQRRAALFR